jgi:hypothetical protein
MVRNCLGSLPRCHSVDLVYGPNGKINLRCEFQRNIKDIALRDHTADVTACGYNNGSATGAEPMSKGIFL